MTVAAAFDRFVITHAAAALRGALSSVAASCPAPFVRWVSESSIAACGKMRRWASAVESGQKTHAAQRRAKRRSRGGGRRRRARQQGVPQQLNPAGAEGRRWLFRFFLDKAMSVHPSTRLRIDCTKSGQNRSDKDIKCTAEDGA